MFVVFRPAVNFETGKKRKQPSSATEAEKTTSKSSKRAAAETRSPTPASSPPRPKKRKEKVVTKEVTPPVRPLAMVTTGGRAEMEASTAASEGPEWVRRCLAEVADRYERAAQVAIDFEGERAALVKDAIEARAEVARTKKKAAAEVVALKAEVVRPKAGTEALVAEVGAAKAVAEAAKAEAEATRAELEAAKAKEAEAATSQGQTFRAFAERLFLSGRFSLLAGELADILNTSVAAEAVEEIASAFPDLDLSKFMVEVPPREVRVRDYAKVLAAGMKDFPVLEELASSSTLLTVEAIRACPVDRDSVLERLVTEVGEGGGEEGQHSPLREAEAAGGGSEATAGAEAEVPEEEEVPVDRPEIETEVPHEEEVPVDRPEIEVPPPV